MNNDITTDIPIGDLQLYDNYIPALEAGNYFITVQHTLQSNGNAVNGDALGAVQEFVVTAPQFSIDATQIVNMYPQAGSTGLYGEVLPHIVLKDPLLPWERTMSIAKTPWMALMVFEASELADGGNADTKSIPTTVSAFLAMKSSTLLTPQPVKEDDIDSNMSCQYIKMSAALFQAIVPRLDELPYLSHVRKVNTGDKPIMGLNELGLFSVTASNRFAAAPGDSLAKPLKNIVHLVSLEGMDNYLAVTTDLSAYTAGVALVSLASWSFLSLPDSSQDFNALATHFVAQETKDDKSIDPGLLWLRLPPPAAGDGAGMTEVANRIAAGYAPLAYHTRSGENSFAWYRGPLAPLLVEAMPGNNVFYTADAAMVYDKTFGVFDVSLASAWEAGREAALSDAYFGQKLLAFRKKAHWLTDSLYYKLQSNHFTATQINQLDNTTTIQDAFLALLTPQLVKDIGEANGAPGGSLPVSAPSTTDPIEETKAFLSDPAVQAALQEMIATDLAPVAEWLGRLLLLYPLPFDNLVPDPRMLPVESLRFFYLDTNWLNAALDGAMSLGLDSSRQTFFSQVTKGMVYDAAMQALAVIRDNLQGIPTGSNPVPPAVMSGFLLRSAMVTGWPNLAIRAKDENDTSLKILRMDHLSSGVLLCIFDGVPKNIEFSEPQESLGFGVDDDGNVVIRDILSPDNTGNQLGLLQIRDLTGKQQLCMRTAAGRELNIAPSDSNGLIQTLVATLKQHNCAAPGDTLGPASFAIQLIKSAEAIVFSSQPS